MEIETLSEEEEEVTALGLLQACYRNPTLNLTTRMRAAMAAIPFETPKLAVTAQVSENDIASKPTSE